MRNRINCRCSHRTFNNKRAHSFGGLSDYFNISKVTSSNLRNALQNKSDIKPRGLSRDFNLSLSKQDAHPATNGDYFKLPFCIKNDD